MSNYFFNFPITQYSFGNNEQDVLFQKLNTYIDLFDQARDQITAYQLYNIQEFERPDTVSFNLYGTPNYGWTFFLMNDNIRKQGWPLSNLDLFEQQKIYYPNIVLTTDQNIGYVDNIRVGDEIALFTDTTQTGFVRKIDYDLGQIYIERDEFFTVSTGRIIRRFADVDATLTVPFDSQLRQYDATFQWQDASGNYVEILDSVSKHVDNDGDPTFDRLRFKDTSTLTKVTYGGKLLEQNLQQKRIKVIKPESIEKFVNEFNRLLKGT